ncbi:MAG: hypothetical protein FWE06_00710 [Oscillospiraceae bacterium]|nr:hypothetical protein [Oscillospiraceae bacterium]
MPETLAQEQRRTKPKLENVIASRECMGDKSKQVAYAFLDYCNARNITYKWSSTNRWNLNIKGKSIGYIGIGARKRDDNSWNILMNEKELVQYQDFIEREGLLETIHNNIGYCIKCHGNCTPKSATILGKTFNNVCSGLCFKNPDADTLESIQKILDFRLQLTHGTASRPILDPATDGLTRINNKLRVSGVSDLHGNANDNISNLFNGKCGDYFYAGPYDYQSNSGSHDILFEMDKPVELKMYGLFTGLRLDVPNGWALYGAESKGGEWILLDAQNEFPKPVTLYTEKAFSIDKPKIYQYYKITLDGSYFVLSQVHLYTK